MQHSTMVRTREIIGKGTPRALVARMGKNRKPGSRRRSVGAPDAAHDDWLQTNAGARAQSDFWLRLLVAGNTRRLPL